MNTFEVVTLNQAQGRSRDLLTEINESFGKVPNTYGVMANSVSTLAAVRAFENELVNASLSNLLKEKIALAVSNENSCQYSVSMHSSNAKKLGMNAEDILDAQKGKSLDSKEQSILALAISLNSNHGHGDNAAVRNAFKAGVSLTEVLEVLGLVVKNIMHNSLNGIAETEMDYPEVELI